MIKADGLLPLLKNKLIEISIGDDFEEIILSDHSRKVSASIFGILQNVIDDFLVVNCFFEDVDGELKLGNIVYINTWQVKTLTEVTRAGSLNDIQMSSTYIRQIRKLKENL